MSVFEEKYTEFAHPRQTYCAARAVRSDAAEAHRPARIRAAYAFPAVFLCLAALLALAGCAKRGQSSLGPLGESGALSTKAVQPAPSGATEGGQVGFFLDVSGSITVRQLGPNGAQQPGATVNGRTATNGGGASAAGAAIPPGAVPAGQGAPIPPRIGDPIYAPDSIQTGIGSTCKIQFGEGVLVELTPRSSIEIPSFPKIAAGGTPPPPVVIVEDGIVLFSVARQASGNALFAATGSAVVATRGGDFLVARLKARTEIAVGRGTVQVGLSRLPSGPTPAAATGSAAAAGTPVIGVETVIGDGVGPNPIDVHAGYEIAVPSALTPGSAGSAAATGAGGSTAPSGGESAPTQRPLSPAYRALLFRGDRSVLLGEPLMKPQGDGADASDGSASAPTAAADITRGGTQGAAAAANAGAQGAGSAAAAGAATQAGPTPPAPPEAPSDPAPPSLRSAE